MQNQLILPNTSFFTFTRHKQRVMRLAKNFVLILAVLNWNIYRFFSLLINYFDASVFSPLGKLLQVSDPLNKLIQSGLKFYGLLRKHLLSVIQAFLKPRSILPTKHLRWEAHPQHILVLAFVPFFDMLAYLLQSCFMLPGYLFAEAIVYVFFSQAAHVKHFSANVPVCCQVLFKVRWLIEPPIASAPGSVYSPVALHVVVLVLLAEVRSMLAVSLFSPNYLKNRLLVNH